jgi:hypothetical protein
VSPVKLCVDGMGHGDAQELLGTDMTTCNTLTWRACTPNMLQLTAHAHVRVRQVRSGRRCAVSL